MARRSKAAGRRPAKTKGAKPSTAARRHAAEREILRKIPDQLDPAMEWGERLGTAKAIGIVDQDADGADGKDRP